MIGSGPRALALLFLGPDFRKHDMRWQNRPVTKDEIDGYLNAIVGSQVVSVEKRDYSWFVAFGPSITVATETLWRLIGQDRIIVTSEDHGHQFGLPEPVDASSVMLSRLRGRAVTAAAIDASSGDLTITFGESLLAQFLQTSFAYESWRLYVHGTEIICTGGGDIVRASAR